MEVLIKKISVFILVLSRGSTTKEETQKNDLWDKGTFFGTYDLFRYRPKTSDAMEIGYGKLT